MSSNTAVIQGALKLIGLPEGGCWSSLDDFLADFPKMFGVEVPETITNVYIGNTQPLDDQRNSLWIRRDNSGSFVGFYVYGRGAWQKIFPLDNQIFRVAGNSTIIPPGFQLADSSVSWITAVMDAKLKEDWLLDPTSSYYVIFDIVYVGF